MIMKWFKRDDGIFLGKQKDSIFYLGCDTKDREIWLDNNTLRQHILVSGTTGSGKTEALLGMFSNAFAWGSGGVYVDGKGDVSIYAKMYALAEHYGRLNDLYVLNFMTRSEVAGAYMQTHRFNPFAKGSSDYLTSLITRLVPPEDYDKADKYGWRGKATAMFTGLMRALCWLRDHRGEAIDAAVLYRSINLNNFIDLAYSEHYSFLPEPIRKSIRGYLSILPSFREELGYEQAQTTKDEHGFLEMQFAKIFGEMAHSYGHIFCAGTSDIDFNDILWNRRFLCVMLPALEKSRDTISLLGRIILAGLQQALCAPLNEGGSANVVGGVPFISVFDDVSYYMVDGLDLFVAQARSMNVGVVFSCGDMTSLSKVSSATVGNIASCVSTKIIMRTCGSNAEVNDIFFDVVSARDDVASGIDKLIGVDARGGSPKNSVFRSPSNAVKHLREGDFVLISSGKLLLGRANYIWSFIPMPKKLSGPTIAHDFAAAAARFIELSEKERKAETLQEVPHRMLNEFLSPHEYAASATEMLSLALKALEPHGEGIVQGTPKTEKPEEEIIRIGE
jgi:Type IV secretory pathway, VirD4 components